MTTILDPNRIISATVNLSAELKTARQRLPLFKDSNVLDIFLADVVNLRHTRNYIRSLI